MTDVAKSADAIGTVYAVPDQSTSSAGDTEHSADSGRLRRSAATALSKYATVVVLVALFGAFSLARPASFPTWDNVTIILTTQVVTALVALGALVPLIAGEFDLSVGYMAGFAAMESAYLSTHGYGTGASLGLTVATAMAIGAVNGALVVALRINAFIATLGVGTVLSGLMLLMSNGAVILGVPTSIVRLGRNQVWSLGLPVFYLAVVAAALYYVTEHMPVGRYLYAIGGGRDAARLAGVPTSGLRAASFVASATIASLAGLVLMASSGSAQPAAGPEYLLTAFAACFLGATTLRPGRFNVLGTMVAVFVLAVGIAGLQQLGTPAWVGPVFTGGTLLVAVGLAGFRNRALVAR